MKILRARDGEVMERGPFKVRHVRPGAADGPGADPAFGPLSLFDHADLGAGTVVRMHEHRNDEILSYMWRGTMQHEDGAGHKVELSSRRHMMMNAGRSFWHEERAPDGPVEMLQIFVRPREADLPEAVSFLERPDGAPEGEWGLVAGPEGSDAGLLIRNAVTVCDAQLPAGGVIELPRTDGLSAFLYVMDGAIALDGETLGKGDGASDAGGLLPPVQALEAAALVLFLVDRAAKASRTGTISGR